jgi:predicted dehydrogenase
MSHTRRHFLGSAGAIGGLAASLPAGAAQTSKVSPNDKVRIALIGCGGMGQEDASSSLANSGVELAAACDVYDGRLAHMREVHTKAVLFTTRDYREVLARPDIDAVIVSTPDHWHSRIAIDAMAAGKDVYVQKPMVQRIEQGQAVVEAQKKTGRILQVGSQRVSSVVYKKAQELFRSGAIGELNMVEAYWDRNTAQGAWVYSIPPDASPATIDWDRFLGDAPRRPFDPIRLFRWRNYQDYGTGVAGDLFVHLFSGVHFILSSNGPTRIASMGGLRYWKDGRDVPDVLLGLFDYPATKSHTAFTLTLRVNFMSGAGDVQRFRFVGSEGVMTVGYNSVSVSRTPKETEPGYNVETFAKATQDAFLRTYREKHPVKRPAPDNLGESSEVSYNPPRRYSDQLDHHRNFIEAVRKRTPVVEDAVFGLRAAAPALASNLSYFDNRIVEWDPEAMRERKA